MTRQFNVYQSGSKDPDDATKRLVDVDVEIVIGHVKWTDYATGIDPAAAVTKCEELQRGIEKYARNGRG